MDKTDKTLILKELGSERGVLGWFTRNHVAANLLMIFLLAAGVVSLFTIKLEVFPEIDTGMITINVPYLGASPEEVESGVCLRLEEAVAGIENIKEMRASASEGVGTLSVEVEDYADIQKVLDDVKAAVDRIETFPEETEKPIVAELTTRTQVIAVVLYGSVSEHALKNLSDEVRDELTALKNISQVDVSGVRRNEISIEISEETLRRYGLTFEQVGFMVRDSSLDLPGGSVKTAGGEILVRTKGQKYAGRDFEDIVVMTRPDGTKLYLREIAKIIDGFEDSDKAARFDGESAAMIEVYRVGEQDALEVARTVKEYVAQKREQMPEGVSMATWFDRSAILKSRLELLTRNAGYGLILVFLSLALFLDLKLAFWTMMGIPISFLGAFLLLPYFDVSVNMMSLFAFIVVLGIVVDDAIVVGENIFSYRQQDMNFLAAATAGVRELWLPVTIAILTTVAAFFPMLFVSGMMGKIMRNIPLVVISVLMISLVEALFILPAHLSRAKRISRRPGPIARLQKGLRDLLDGFVRGPFLWFLSRCIRWRYATLAVAFGVMFIVLGWVAGGHIGMRFMPDVEADDLSSSLVMPQGTPREQTELIVAQIEAAAEELRREIDAFCIDENLSIFRHISTTIGQAEAARTPMDTVSSASGAHLAELHIELLPGEERGFYFPTDCGVDVSSAAIGDRWREKVGEIAGISSLTFSYSMMNIGEAINVELSHQDFDELQRAVEDLKLRLREYNGVSDIADNFLTGKKEIKLSLNEQGRSLGLTLFNLARQVRQGFYGEEVQRIQRGRDDIRVMLRYPAEERRSLADMENMRIRLAGGVEVPFNTVAVVQEGRGYSTINRAERRRVIQVTADVDEESANATDINKELADTVLPDLQGRFPGLFFDFQGQQREMQDSMGSLWMNFAVALLIIFGLLAVQFKSYVQPLIVMSAIPFGLIGAVIGHVIMGFDLSLLSMFGFVALTGVVVNDSLIMVDLINRTRESGAGLEQVVKDSATRRFRPIMLTTLTTFFGLMPMILEKSMQARFLIPMAVSLAYGVVFATGITLVLVPSLYVILEDVKGVFRRSS
ncbi:MAG: efflux RND transporter permease subunit [Planctomycetes bacterium]|nr:efflux RND transporter permease subunit [Planctomycetota bacterium]